MAGHDPDQQRYYLIMFTVAMCNIRNISAGLEIAKFKKEGKNLAVGSSSTEQTVPQPESEDGHRKADETCQHSDPPCSHSVTNMLIYVFYLPLFFTGPILTYDKFFLQVRGQSMCALLCECLFIIHMHILDTLFLSLKCKNHYFLIFCFL